MDLDALALAAYTGDQDAVGRLLREGGWRPPKPEPPPDELRALFMAYVEPWGDHWLWTGHIDRDGYGQFRRQRAHRVSYRLFVAPIPVGLVVDHWRPCFRHCVAPGCLEAVTALENTRRGIDRGNHNGGRETCIRGHRFDLANTYVDPAGKRFCKTCRRDHQRKYRARTRG